MVDRLIKVLGASTFPTTNTPLVCVGGPIFFEVGEETDDGGGGAKLGEADEKRACVNKHSCQPDFLGSEETGQHEEGSQEADKDPQIGHNSALNALSGYDSQDKY